MKSAVVITTIFSPTKAVRAYCDQIKLPLIVIGDRKTPMDWGHSGADYFDIDAQNRLYPVLSKLIPINHYARKNIGYIIAATRGADSIYETDDDNIPESNWFLPDAEGVFEVAGCGLGFVNVYSRFTKQHIWPRGLPLQDVLSDKARIDERDISLQSANVGVWQGLANGDPDVDAIYRLVINQPCIFENRDPIVLGRGTYCPYNSQNTLTFRDFFPLLYLPSYVNFRYTDILRGLVGQVILQHNNSHLGFYPATVFQERNIHNFYRDFIDELPCYLHPYDVLEVAESVAESSASVQDNLFNIYSALGNRGIIASDQELPIIEEWLREVCM